MVAANTTNNRKIMLYCAALEVLYLSLSFVLGKVYGQWSYQGEILRTGLRLVVIAVFAFCFRRYFYYGKQVVKPERKRILVFVLLVIALFVFAFFYTSAANETVIWQMVFAVSGVFAGIREELFYRGMLQNYLQTKSTYALALFLTSLIFTLSHVQYIYLGQFVGLAFITLAGVIFGCIFIFSRSIVLTCAIHGLYDMLLSVDLSPIKLSNNTALVVLFTIMSLFLILINNYLTKQNQTRC